MMIYHRKAEEALAESEGKFRELFESANDAIFLHTITHEDKPGRFVEVNNVALKKLGYSKKEMLKMSPADIDHTDDLNSMGGLMERLLKNKSITFERNHISKTGNLIPVEINSRIFTTGGEQYILSIARDITERKKTEEKLRKSEAKWRQLLESVPNFVFEVDRDGKILNCNKQYPGFAIKDFIGKSIFDVSPDQSRDKLKTLFPKVIKEETSIEFETQPYEPEVSNRWYYHQIAPVKDGMDIKSFLMIISDITERKKAEEILKESQQKISAIVNNIVDGIITVSNAGEIISVNKATKKIFGYEESELIGNNIDILMPDSVKENHDSFFTGIGSNEKCGAFCIQRESQAVRKDSTIFPIEITVNEFLFDNKKMYTVAIRDITEKKNMEKEIKKIRMEYEAFLRHELKNHLTPAKGYLDLLLKFNHDNLSDEQKEYLDRINSSTEKMDYLIDKLKSLQDFETGRYSLEKVDYDLYAVIKYVVNDLKRMAEDAEVEVETEFMAERSQITMDRKLLPGVFYNLTKNAIEHVSDISDISHKKIKISVFNENGNIVTKINNRGSVIPPEKLQLFFEKFNSNKSKKHNGTGLGTTYAYLVTKAHGGEIKVESNEASGTTVTLKFTVINSTSEIISDSNNNGVFDKYDALYC
jgi:PAS domain S-box-containing protein